MVPVVVIIWAPEEILLCVLHMNGMNFTACIVQNGFRIDKS